MLNTCDSMKSNKFRAEHAVYSIAMDGAVDDAIYCDHRITIFSICCLTALLHAIYTFLIFYYSVFTVTHSGMSSPQFIGVLVWKKSAFFYRICCSTHNNQMRSTVFRVSFARFWLLLIVSFLFVSLAVASLVLSIIVLCRTIVTIPAACTVCSARFDVSLCASNGKWYAIVCV